jgi:hypothetical protein
MALLPTYNDRVKETTVTGGTGPVTLAGPVADYQSWSAVFPDGAQVYYCITDNVSQWEVGQGTFNLGANTISRDTVFQSSNANALVNFSTASKIVFNTIPAYDANNLTRYRSLINFIDMGPAEGFASGSYCVTQGRPFVTQRTWYVNSTMTQKILDLVYVRNNYGAAVQKTWTLYQTDGVTVLAHIVDTINYIGAFESTRSRLYASP